MLRPRSLRGHSGPLDPSFRPFRGPEAGPAAALGDTCGCRSAPQDPEPAPLSAGPGRSLQPTQPTNGPSGGAALGPFLLLRP